MSARIYLAQWPLDGTSMQYKHNAIDSLFGLLIGNNKIIVNTSKHFAETAPEFLFIRLNHFASTEQGLFKTWKLVKL